MKRISILGSTGSIGRQCLSVTDSLPGRFEIVALAAGSNIALAAEQAVRHRPKIVSVATEAGARKLCDMLSGSRRPAPEILFGSEGIERVATHPDAEIVVSAAVGVVGLPATYKAIECGKQIALANKEVLVAAGEVVMAAAQRHGVSLLPVDSEHNAIHQCLRAGQNREVKRLVLTASGGPFRKTPISKLGRVTPKQALAHPNWKMGQRITIDSATLMNKGLELIEAQHLFALEPDQLDVVVHPQSIVHGLVEFRDGSVIAQLGSPDMRIPISHCLAWPVRMATPAPRLDLARVGTLSFEEPDMTRFPALAIARRALAAGGAAPTILNAANEVAVREFVDRRLGFCEIAALVEATLELSERRGEMAEPQSVEEALAIDHNARRMAAELLPEIAAMAS